jgi:hypothetical protein
MTAGTTARAAIPVRRPPGLRVLAASAAMAVASWAAGALLTLITARLHQSGRHPARRAWVTAGLDAAHRGHWRDPLVSWSCVL